MAVIEKVDRAARAARRGARQGVARDDAAEGLIGKSLSRRTTAAPPPLQGSRSTYFLLFKLLLLGWFTNV